LYCGWSYFVFNRSKHSHVCVGLSGIKFIIMISSSSSSSSSYICHGVGPLVDPFRSHASRSLFKGLPWFVLPVGE
jgi:hypothetical protein